MTKKSDAPAIRFKGFSDAWEQRKLGELALFNPKDELPRTFEYVDLESVVGTEMLSHRTEVKSSAPSRAQRLAHTGDLFYQTVRPYQKNNYLFEKPDNNYVFSTGYAQMRPYVDGYFLLSLVQSERFVKVVLDNCTGTSYPAINANDLAEIEVAAPSDESEAQKIGTIFRSIDNLITLHQRQPFLQSPPDISLIVQLTPPFYTFSWEQRKLGELALFNPKDELPRTFEYVDLESVVGTEMLSHRTEVKSSAPSRAQRLAHTGDLFYQTVRPYQKNNYLFEKPDNNYVFSTGYAQMRPYVDGYFLLSLVQSERFVKVVLDNCTGTSYPAINANDLAEIEVAAPSDESEAQKIGTIFRCIDNLITLHQRQTIVYAVIRSIRKVILAERQYFAPPMVRKSP